MLYLAHLKMLKCHNSSVSMDSNTLYNFQLIACKFNSSTGTKICDYKSLIDALNLELFHVDIKQKQSFNIWDLNNSTKILIEKHSKEFKMTMYPPKEKKQAATIPPILSTNESESVKHVKEEVSVNSDIRLGSLVDTPNSKKRVKDKKSKVIIEKTPQKEGKTNDLVTNEEKMKLDVVIESKLEIKTDITKQKTTRKSSKISVTNCDKDEIIVSKEKSGVSATNKTAPSNNSKTEALLDKQNNYNISLEKKQNKVVNQYEINGKKTRSPSPKQIEPVSHTNSMQIEAENPDIKKSKKKKLKLELRQPLKDTEPSKKESGNKERMLEDTTNNVAGNLDKGIEDSVSNNNSAEPDLSSGWNIMSKKRTHLHGFKDNSKDSKGIVNEKLVKTSTSGGYVKNMSGSKKSDKKLIRGDLSSNRNIIQRGMIKPSIQVATSHTLKIENSNHFDQIESTNTKSSNDELCKTKKPSESILNKSEYMTTECHGLKSIENNVDKSKNDCDIDIMLDNGTSKYKKTPDECSSLKDDVSRMEGEIRQNHEMFNKIIDIMDNLTSHTEKMAKQNQEHEIDPIPLEAVILKTIDDFDARINMTEKHVQNMGENMNNATQMLVNQTHDSQIQPQILLPSGTQYVMPMSSSQGSILICNQLNQEGVNEAMGNLQTLQDSSSQNIFNSLSKQMSPEPQQAYLQAEKASYQSAQTHANTQPTPDQHSSQQVQYITPQYIPISSMQPIMVQNQQGPGYIYMVPYQPQSQQFYVQPGTDPHQYQQAAFSLQPTLGQTQTEPIQYFPPPYSLEYPQNLVANVPQYQQCIPIMPQDVPHPNTSANSEQSVENQTKLVHDPYYGIQNQPIIFYSVPGPGNNFSDQYSQENVPCEGEKDNYGASQPQKIVPVPVMISGTAHDTRKEAEYHMTHNQKQVTYEQIDNNNQQPLYNASMYQGTHQPLPYSHHQVYTNAYNNQMESSTNNNNFHRDQDNYGGTSRSKQTSNTRRNNYTQREDFAQSSIGVPRNSGFKRPDVEKNLRGITRRN